MRATEPADGETLRGETLDGEAARQLLHPALEADAGCPLEQARLTDRERLNVVLQAAALMAHCEHGGWILRGGWDEVRLTEDALLRVDGLRRGRPLELVQVALRELLGRLFRTGEIKGRGQGRRAARHLADRWRQVLAPASADQAIADILDAAPFLWDPAFAAARASLVAEHRVGERGHLWIAGPGPARRRLLAAAGGCRRRASELVAGPRARDLWEDYREDADPRELAAHGLWRQAVETWRRRPPREWAEVRLHARCLFALGRYSQTLTALRGQRRFEARLLRAWCQLYLGELTAGYRTVQRLAKKRLGGEKTLQLTEIAIRFLAARGQPEEIRGWVERGLEAADSRPARLEAHVIAAEAAWDCGEAEAMDRHLASSREALADPRLAGRWHHVRGLRSIAAADGQGAVEHVAAALAHGRRQMLRAEAGRLWNDLAVGRVFAGDLPGAERACRHALLLLTDCEGPSRSTLALYNLAEVRLRRGRMTGVAEALEISTAENRRAGNVRGLARDLELWVRLELAHGRAVAALARAAEALQQLSASLGERRCVFEVLSARAHGWLGRRRQAAACLERARPEAVGELEPEERPAVWALAGEPGSASDEAAGTPWAELWTAIASGAHPRPRAWEQLEILEPYRAARLVFDCELALPGAAPPSLVHRAVVTLRRGGAEALAEKLESRSQSPWRALEGYLTRARTDARAAADLLAAAGYGDARLAWIGDHGVEVLVDGSGGEEKLSATLPDGAMELRAPIVDGVLRALFALLGRDLEGSLGGEGARGSRAADREIVGESPKLVETLRRLDRLARQELPILILGESGTGKELAARRAHRASRRRDGPFLALNCAALSDTLIHSDLFGHVKGAFTGADRDRAGIFEAAHDGTVFLDEIGDLPLSAQGKLLRVLQEGEIRRLGESFHRKTNARIVAATHRDLEQMVREGSFREDLFFRLRVATLELPPLRERGEDVLLLAEHFLASRPGRSAPRLAPRVRSRLLAHAWPGNVRELKNVLEVAAALAEDGVLRSEHVDLPNSSAAQPETYHQMIDGLRKRLVGDALKQAGGNRSEAARQLGLSRQSLSYLARQLDLT